MIEALTPLPAPPRRVLIVKPSALGDVVTALPVLHGLHRTFPHAKLSWLVSTSCAGLLDGEADLNETILFDRRMLGRFWRSPAAAGALRALRRRLRAGEFDWVIDLQGLLRSGLMTRWTRAPLRAGFADAREGATAFYNRRIAVQAKHTVDRNIELIRQLGVDARGEDMTLTVSPRGREFADALRRELRVERGGFWVLVPPTRWATKQYPARHWREVTARLARRRPVVLTGSSSPSERDLCRRIAEDQGPGVLDLSGRTNVAELVGLIAASGGVVCCDSAAKFIAPAVGVDCVTLIGPTRIERTGPYLRGKALTAEVACQGCLKKRCRHVTCMQSIPPDLVAQTAEGMIPA